MLAHFYSRKRRRREYLSLAWTLCHVQVNFNRIFFLISMFNNCCFESDVSPFSCLRISVFASASVWWDIPSSAGVWRCFAPIPSSCTIHRLHPLGPCSPSVFLRPLHWDVCFGNTRLPPHLRSSLRLFLSLSFALYNASFGLFPRLKPI